MLLAGKKIVVVGGSSGIGLATAELAKREGADVIVVSRNVERLDKVAEKLNAIAIPADVTSDDSVTELFRACGPVDHVVVTAAQLRTGPFKSVAMDDVRSTMESKFWGAWRVARSARNPPRRITHAGFRLSQRSPAVEFSDRQRRQRRAGIAVAGAGARTGAGAGELCIAWDHRHSDPCRDARSGAPRHACQNRRRAAGRPGRHRRGYRAADTFFHGEWLCDGFDSLYRWRRIGDLIHGRDG